MRRDEICHCCPVGASGRCSSPTRLKPSRQVGSEARVRFRKYDLVDEFWLKIFPITLGSGKRSFADGTSPAAFKLTESKVSPLGVIIANYKRAGEVKTGLLGA